jgi:predicted alpha/beta hydrolase family esterase
MVPGLHDSGPGHWQSLWQQREPRFERVEQEHWDRPEIAVWSARIASTLRRSARAGVLVAHSFGCLAALHCAAGGARNLHGMFLVAPPDPERFGLVAALRGLKPGCPVTLVASANDPWMPVDAAAWWARQWGAEFVDAGRLGHINADSGIGAWPQGVALFESLLERLPAPVCCACNRREA